MSDSEDDSVGMGILPILQRQAIPRSVRGCPTKSVSVVLYCRALNGAERGLQKPSSLALSSKAPPTHTIGFLIKGLRRTMICNLVAQIMLYALP